MRRLVLLIGLCALVEGKLVYELAEKQLKGQLQGPGGNGMACDIDDLELENELTDCEEIESNLVPHGVRCMTYSSNLDLSSVARCLNGQWITGETSSVYHHRNKRFLGTLFALIKIGLAIAELVCIFVCGPTSEAGNAPVVKKAPSYGNTCPPSDIQSEYFASEGTREVVVTWTTPSATDDDGTIASDEQTSKPLKGERFMGSIHGLGHTVTYKAKDNDGLLGYCSFQLTVTVRTCLEIARISHGYKECSEGSIYGSVCSFHCDQGYERSGDSTAKCREDGTWSGTASCSKTQCETPNVPTNGAVTCSNPEYEYLSTCFVHCNKGFKLEEGPVVMQCQANQTWSMAGVPWCVDVEPPTIECLTPQIFYADKGLLTASSVVWEEPRVYDAIDENPVVAQTRGPQQNAILTEERTHVSYVAMDGAGNESPECSIEIRVEPITCGHPTDTLTDTKLIFNCSDSLYHYGVTCKLSCDLNLPLDGADTVECEANTQDEDPTGIWDWGSGAKPYCREVNCPKLNPPRNGSFITDSFMRRPVVFMQCNDQFDTAGGIDNFVGKLECADSGNWRPLLALPDCVELHDGRSMRLPSKLYYYSGECSDPATLDQIKQKFLTIITNATESRFHNLCSPDLLKCSLDSVTITCGPTRRRKRDLVSDIRHHNGKLTETYPVRRRREISDTPHHINKREDTYVTTLQFSIVTEWDQGNLGSMGYSQQLAHIDEFQIQQKDVIVDLMVDGKLNIEGYILKNESFQLVKNVGDLACAHGMIKDGTKCKPCPRGRYFAGEEKCTECPIGQYRDTDHTIECENCPEGMSTEKNGSVSIENCTKICRPGSFSKKGLVPCSLCQLGTYQDSDGMTGCDPCPSGQTTATQGSTTQAACQGFDALLRTTTQDVSIGSIPAIEDLSLMFWAKLFSAGTMSMTSFKLKDESDTVLMTINIAPEISVQVGDNLLEAAVILSDTKWDHVAVVWNHDMSSIKVFIDGELKNGMTVSMPFQANGSMAVHSNASEGVYLTGLVVVDKILKEEDIKPLLTSCTETTDGAFLSMDSLLGKSSNAIKIITPAICDAIDECSTSPCGDHLCINEIGNFSCICSQGMTGRFCDIPMDYCKANKCKYGATCNNHENGYNCSCLEGYSGDFCEISPVNGGWSEYGEWSSCTVSCEQGTRTRSRTCDNPPTGIGGQPCSGSELDFEDCNLRPCKECSKAPPRCNGIFPNCSTNPTSGIRQCFPYCRNGTSMQPAKEIYEHYTCGPNTDYEWTPFTWCADCVDEAEKPKKLQMITTMGYDTVSSSSETDVKTKIENELSSRTDCANKGLCQVDVSLDNSGTRRKRDTGSVLQITFDVVPGNSGELKIDEYVDSGTVSAGLQELVDAIVSLELTAADLQANASSYFNVKSGGVTYTINDTSLTLEGIIDCPAGSVPDDGVCVACPIGTKVDSNSCVYCDVGTYQDESGQTDCKQCPSGFSTSTIGASDVLECTESVSVTATTTTAATFTTTDPSTQPDESADEDEHKKTQNKSGTIAGIAIGSFAVFLAAIAITLVCYYKHARKKHRHTQRGSFASLNMVGQRNSRPASNPRSMQTSHTPTTAVNPLPPVFHTRAGADALMKEKDFGELDDLTTGFTVVPPRTTSFTPPPPYTENP